MNEVLGSDNGLIALALETYANFVAQMGGPVDLQTRALVLATEFRNKPLEKTTL
jgi:hypothetical protein